MKKLYRKFFILVPVILVLLLFAWAIWLFIGIGANDYLESVAEKSVSRQMGKIVKEVNIHRDNLLLLDNDIKKHFSSESSSPQLLILDKEKVEIYHSSRRNYRDQMSAELKQRFMNGDIKEMPEILNIDGENYEVAVYTINQKEIDLSTIEMGLSTDLSTYPRDLSAEKYDDKAKNREDTVDKSIGRHYIVYQRIGNAMVLLKQIRTYIIYITIPMIILASFIIYLISRVIDKRELQLQVARERAEEAAKAQAQREKLFRDISHDLRTPLVSIIGYAEGLRSGIMKDTEAAAAVIVRESNRMQRLLESGLTLSKLNSNAWKVNSMPVDVVELIDEQVEVLRKLDDKKILRFEKNGDDVDDFVMNTDPDLLIRIIQNIVSDCMRYAESVVTITLTVSDDVYIDISDDGPGILREDLPHLFEPYYKGKDGKYGIGLSVVASAVRYLGGQVLAKNREITGRGAIFTLILPIENQKVENM